MSTLVQSAMLSAQPVYLDYCPMKKSYWLSSEKAIQNPYYGKEMPACGSIEKTFMQPGKHAMQINGNMRMNDTMSMSSSPPENNNVMQRKDGDTSMHNMSSMQGVKGMNLDMPMGNSANSQQVF